ncbi:MAG: Holliday junction branch migration protein RuvA [bacterium]
MITFLDGLLEEKEPGRAVLNVAGVGYEVQIPLSSYEHLPAPGARCRILIHDHIREDAHLLFGFASETERRLFVLLLCVSGIGPKIALSALSGMSVRELVQSIVGRDVKRLSSISGIGKKTAERLVVELRDRISEGDALASVAAEPTVENLKMRDAILALVTLGYRRGEAQELINKRVTPELLATAAIEDVVRKVLAG